jgi:hypothetical protein
LVAGDLRLVLRHLRPLRVLLLAGHALRAREGGVALEVELGVGQQRLVLRLLRHRLV